MKNKGIWIPIEVLHDKSLSMQEKLIMLEIGQLQELDTNNCYASNEHFSKLLNVSKKSISNALSSLVKKEKITLELSERNHKRLLSIKDGRVSSKDGHPSIKDGETKDNKTINKTINTIVEFLNSTTNKRYRATNTTKTLIKSRLKEGFTLEDFKHVIEIKNKQWKDDEKMKAFIRPDTLFGTKFDGYLNQELKKEDNDWSKYAR